MDTVFDLRNISYSYVGKIDALKDISLKVGHGEQISIIGSNGSGKSTLLAILNGLIYPTSGEFYAFDNEIIEEVFDSVKDNEFRSFFRTRVGFVFQNSDIQLFSPTVFEEIAFGPLQLDVTPEKVKTRVEDVLKMMEITKLRDRSPHTLSGGEKKKGMSGHGSGQQSRCSLAGRAVRRTGPANTALAGRALAGTRESRKDHNHRHA
jgi:cobalt/nickel transport system ATP-binding protein